MSNFRVTDVLKSAFSTTLRNAVPFALVSILFAIPATGVETLSALFDLGTVARFLLGIAPFAAGFFVTAILSHAAYHRMSGGRATMFDSLRAASGRVFSVAGVTALLGLGSVVCMVPVIVSVVVTAVIGPMGGFLFPFAAGITVIAAIIFHVMFSVAIPAAVIEELSPLNAMARSRSLTEGSKASIFVVFLVLALGAMLLYPLIAVIASALSLGSVVSVAFVAVWSLAVGTFFPTLSAAIYRETAGSWAGQRF